MKVKLPRSALPSKASNSTSSSPLDSLPSPLPNPLVVPSLVPLLEPLLRLRRKRKSPRKKSTWEVSSVEMMMVTERLSDRPRPLFPVGF